MIATLESMSEGTLTCLSGLPSSIRMNFNTDEETDERQIRDEFNVEHGAHLPADICLCIENPPTTWEIVPWHGEAVEMLPDIDYDLLVEVSLSLFSSEWGKAAEMLFDFDCSCRRRIELRAVKVVYRAVKVYDMQVFVVSYLGWLRCHIYFSRPL